MVLHFDRLTFVDCQVLLVLFFFDSLFFEKYFQGSFSVQLLQLSGKLKKHLQKFLGLSANPRHSHGFKVGQSDLKTPVFLIFVFFCPSSVELRHLWTRSGLKKCVRHPLVLRHPLFGLKVRLSKWSLRLFWFNSFWSS